MVQTLRSRLSRGTPPRRHHMGRRPSPWGGVVLALTPEDALHPAQHWMASCGAAANPGMAEAGARRSG